MDAYIEILVKPGEEVLRTRVFDNNGRMIGELRRLKEPVIVSGVKYTHSITVKAKEGVSYVLKAETANGKALNGNFSPAYTIRIVKNYRWRRM